MLIAARYALQFYYPRGSKSTLEIPLETRCKIYSICRISNEAASLAV